MVQGKDTLNEKQSLPCWCWCHSPLSFLHIFLRFVILSLLHHRGKLTIPRDRLFLILQILHLVLFKLLQRQGELSISGDRRDDLPFLTNGFVAISFRPSVSKCFPPCAAAIQRGLRSYKWQVKTLCWCMALYRAVPLTS